MLKEPPFADSLANGSNRDEDLLTVDDEPVAVAFGMGADGLEVAAGVRLRHAERADRLAPDHFRQPAALLLLCPEGEDVGRDEIGMNEEAWSAGPDPPQLLEHDDIEQVVET